MFTVLPLSPDPEGHKVFKLGSFSFEFVTRFNYAMSVWTMDIFDGAGVLLVSGLILIPNVNLIKPYSAISAKIGSLAIVELNDGDHNRPFLLGSQVQLLWWSIGTQLVLP